MESDLFASAASPEGSAFLIRRTATPGEFRTRGKAKCSHAIKIEHGNGGNSPATKGAIQTARRSSRTEGVIFFVSGTPRRAC